eukprot:1476149-Rhodomonas_salina.6
MPAAPAPPDPRSLHGQQPHRASVTAEVPATQSHQAPAQPPQSVELPARALTQTLVDLAPLARYLAPDRHDAILMPPVQGTEMELADCSCIPDSFCGAGYDLAAT